MKKVFYVWQREVISLFTSPVGYVAVAALTLINSFFFWLIAKSWPFASMQPLFGNMSITLLFFAPAFTMRQLAEEKRSGTMELLFTAPLTDVQVVLGKYLGAFTLFLFSVVASWIYPAFLAIYGSPDFGPIAAGYLGLLLIGGCYLVVGLFVSSLTKNQIVAFIGSLGILLVIFFLEAAIQLPDNWMMSVLAYLSLSSHFMPFTKGLIDLGDVVFYVSFIAFFLFATVRSVESRKWR